MKSSVRIKKQSTELMQFIVQDLLDYAQIKSSKFRKNYAHFDIRKAVNEVLELQQQTARVKKLNLSAKFVNIRKSHR